ncbi:AraC family transcriptional regulator [Paenibacillus sp. BIHB 4019]|uniref:AraC family transcriptional regulator n=1 Tax=Paenibacillus sp. BIHB 4019 TaxID=1870819 RepID=A0A1B2DC61_9BACL|nr:AraC family transcriptional regulator [Paenibacillus sp. BIHB 4019]ANY65286.1 AraC family transcriptional regulator [Paenibacillus sp. BIHB 4019]
MDLTLRHSLREDRMHGDVTFPLAAYWMEYAPGEVNVDCHWHDEAEFLVVLEGEMLFQIDTEYFPVRAGEAVFIDSGDIHAGHSLNGSSCTYCAIVFDVRWLDSTSYDAVQETCVRPFQEKKKTFPRHISPDSGWKRQLLFLLRCMINCCRAPYAGFEAAVKGYFYLMLHEIAIENRACNRSEARTDDRTRIERLKKSILYIQLHYRRQIRIGELAEQIPMSEGQFFRFFKSMTRQTPVEYLNAYRVNQAAELLLHTERKISDIALEVGFDHISYFVKVFRKTLNCTPSDFRKQKRNPAQNGALQGETAFPVLLRHSAFQSEKYKPNL